MVDILALQHQGLFPDLHWGRVLVGLHCERTYSQKGSLFPVSLSPSGPASFAILYKIRELEVTGSFDVEAVAPEHTPPAFPSYMLLLKTFALQTSLLGVAMILSFLSVLLNIGITVKGHMQSP